MRTVTIAREESKTGSFLCYIRHKLLLDLIRTMGVMRQHQYHDVSSRWYPVRCSFYCLDSRRPANLQN